MTNSKRTNGGKNWVGASVAQLRKKKGLSQNDLAVQLQKHGVDIGKNAIQLMEHGNRSIRDMELYLIANVLEISIADLFTGIPESGTVS